MSILQDLLAQGQQIQASSVAQSSRHAYTKVIKVYEKACNELIKISPYPITVDKMIGFIVLKKNQNRQASTLLNYIAGFSWYFRHNNLDNLTQTIQFKEFKCGLRRVTMSDTFPYQKHPFDPNWFQLILKEFPVTFSDNLRFMFLITLCYTCFLRVSEALLIKKKDILVNEEEERMDITIKWSKTDQLGKGEISYIFKSDSISNPWNYKEILNFLKDDDHIAGVGVGALRSHLKMVLEKIGIKNVQNYSFHSFRRGAAFHASKNGVTDSVIKKHGRWRSEAYVRYVQIDAMRAGREVTEALRK